MKTEKQQTVAIVGLGLIGASLALALKGKYRVVGCSRSKKTEAYALQHGVVDDICPVHNLRGVDCVIVCTPLWVLRQSVQEVYEAVGDSAVITDVGSVKGILRGLPGRIVGGHPMAGTEHSGIEAAKERLFENAFYCVVPYENSCEQDVAFVTELAERIKAKPIVLSAERHDSIVANFSHMPHLAAYALAEVAIGDDLAIAGSGFMDCTRIAESDPAFWTEVCRLNRENILRATDGYMRQLQTMRDLLAEEKYDDLCAVLTSAQTKRHTLSASRNAQPNLTVSVDVEDRVGSIGAVVDLLTRHGVNLTDLRILHSREGAVGALMLALETGNDAEKARQALIAAGYTIS